MKNITPETVMRVVAIALMLTGAVIFVAASSPGAGFPLVAIGLAMVVILMGDDRRHGPAN